jgi:hypothetical protein
MRHPPSWGRDTQPWPGYVGSMRLRGAAISTWVVLATLGAVSVAHGAVIKAPRKPVRAQISVAPTPIRDVVVHHHLRLPLRSRGVHAAGLVPGFAHGGLFTTPSGAQVTLYESPSLTPDDAMLQGWANFFDSLTHGVELSSLTLYIAPLGEMRALCGGEEDTESCYSPDDQTIVLTSEPPPGGDSIEAIAAHEYGHQVAANRLNDLGRADDWGPEYWATDEQICYRTDQGTAFPGDEGDNYSFNPGEAWAETFRVMNGQNPSAWDIIDPSFQPDDAALAAARRDVLQPYDGGEYIDRRSRFHRHGSRWKNFMIPVQNDGQVDLRLTSTGSLDADIYVYPSRSARTPIGKGTRPGRREHYHDTYCGYAKLDVGVYRYRGTGSFKLRATLPFNTTG